MTTTRRLILTAALLASTAALSGCWAVAATAAGVGTYAYTQGELNTTFEGSLDRVYAAAQAAVNDLQFEIDEQSKDALQAQLRVKQADGTNVRIRLDRQTDSLTEVRVRVGVFGDEGVSRAVLDKIRENL